MGTPLKMHWTVIAATTGLGVEGLGSAFVGPGADLGVITAAWVGMITTLAIQAKVEMDKSTALKLATAILLSIGGFIGGTKLAIQAFSYTGIGTIPAMVANGGINAVVTYLTGKAIAVNFVQVKRIDSVEDFARAIVAAVLATMGLSGGDGPSA